MAKYSNKELADFVLASSNIDNEAKSQLVHMLRSNKTYGLVWEDNPEEAVEKMRSEIPMLLEDADKFVTSSSNEDPCHILIEGDNIHAISTLCYSHEGKFDVIYIDPPYNTGAKDWKYNNNYIDDNDTYRHSKWLSLMANRLRVAKRLLNPENSCLIVTIDENEFLHLGCLLEDIFPNANMQMITSVISPGGRGKKKGTDFTRTEEYIFFLRFGECVVYPEVRVEEQIPLPWRGLIRGTLANGRGKHGVGACGPNQFYPIYVNNYTRKIEKIGEPIMEGVSRFSVPVIPGCTAVFPVRPDGTEMNWGCVPDEAKYKLEHGYLRVTSYSPNKPQQYNIQYLTKGSIKDIEEGKAIIEGRAADGSVYGYYPSGKPMLPTTVWNISSHNAAQNGTELLKKIFGEQKFDYPKSLYAVEDCLRHILREKKEALVLDFFAGSGTTLHAIMELNHEDGGKRKCILVTNNENGICEEVTYERNKKVIQGYTTPSGAYVEGLSNNQLRYFKVNFIKREQTHQGKRKLFFSAVDLIRIKEECYHEKLQFGKLSLDNKANIIRYFEEPGKMLLVIFDPRVIRFVTQEIQSMNITSECIKIYVFADGAYPYKEDFKDVIGKVDLIPMPYAIEHALKYVLPPVVDDNIVTAELSEEEMRRLVNEANELTDNE